jgi:ribosomal protein S17E
MHNIAESINNDYNVKYYSTTEENKYKIRVIDPDSIEIKNQIANYTIYTLDSLGKYNVAIYVGNTAVYAYCDSENKVEIQKILDAIDYLKA